jgi:hypothetical protein
MMRHKMYIITVFELDKPAQDLAYFRLEFSSVHEAVAFAKSILEEGQGYSISVVS